MEVLVKGLEPGQKYIFQARSKGPNGQVSPWSTTFKATLVSDVTAPNPITGLTWVVNGTGFSGAWTRPSHDSNGKPLKDFNGYVVTVSAGSISRSYVVNQESFDFTFDQNIAAFGAPEPTVEISVKVRDIVGNLSTPVTETATNPIPPNVTNFVAEGISLAVSLAWDATTIDDLKYFEVYMSTTNGFTPSSGNLLTRTTSTSFVVPLANPVTHYFKIRQVDFFEQPSASFVEASATPELSSGIDLTPPDAPTNVDVVSAPEIDGYSSISVNWDAVVSSNLAEYVIRYSLDEVAWRYVTVPSDETSAIITGLIPGEDYYIAVASLSYVNSYSAFVTASTYPIAAAIDTTAPSKPSAPTITTGTQLVQVAHDMQRNAGGNLEADTVSLEVHASTLTGFTPNVTTLRGTIDVAAQGIPVNGIFPYDATESTTQVYWKVIAVDRAGNSSPASDQRVGLPGLIESQHIADATITNAKIQSVSAGKLEAGSAFINDLSVRSSLTIDHADGKIATDNFDAGTESGWQIDRDGLVIYDGTIKASTLQLQDSANIAPPVFADFEFNKDYYHDGTNIPNSGQLTATSGMLLEIDEVDQKVGNQSLRVYNTAVTPSTTHDLVFATDGLTTNGLNIDINPGEYIVSVWAKKNGTPNQSIKLGVYTDAASTIVSSAISVTSASWSRYFATLVIPSGVSKVKLFLNVGPQASQTGYDILIDALQVERKIGGLDDPSPWKPPSSTTIDGGAIITGSIRSSAPANGLPNQPAWSINTQGNMQIGDAHVRGSLIVGRSEEARNLVPVQFASFEETATNYRNGSNDPNNNYINYYLVNTGIPKYDIVTGTVGSQALRIWSPGALANGETWTMFTPLHFNMGGNNIYLETGQTYIVSGWIKSNNLTMQPKVGFQVWNSTGVFQTVASPIDPTGSWVRYYGSFTAVSGSMQLGIKVNLLAGAPTGWDISIDGLQLEKAAPGQTIPTDFELPGTLPSNVQSVNYMQATRGWRIKSDGSVEFNNGTFRGIMDIYQLIEDQEYGITLRNRTTLFRTPTGTTTSSSVAGTAPAINFRGYSRQQVLMPDGSLVYDPNSPSQGVLRMTPAGRIQLMYAPTNSTSIFDVDGNYLYSSSTSRINDYYSFAVSDWGADRKGPQTYSRPLTSGYSHQSRSFMADSAGGATSPKMDILSSHYAKSASERGYLYNTLGDATQSVEGYHRFISGNKIKANFDEFAHGSGTTYYNAQTLKTNISSTTITSSLWAAGRKDLKGYKMTVNNTTAEVYIASSTSDYSFALIPGTTKVMISGWFSSAKAGATVQAVLVPNVGSPILGETKSLNITPALAGLVKGEPYCYGYYTIIEVPISSTATNSYIGFKFGGLASGDYITMTALTLGNYNDDNDRLRFAKIGQVDNLEGYATVKTTYNPYPDLYEYAPASIQAATTNSSNWAEWWAPSQLNDKTLVQLISRWKDNTQDITRIAGLSRNGWFVGKKQEPQMPQGVSLRNTSLSGQVASSAIKQLYLGLNPALSSLTKWNGFSMQANWNEMGTTYVQSAIGGTEATETDWQPALFTAQRAGLYLLTASAKVEWGVGSDGATPAALEWVTIPAGSNPATTSGSSAASTVFNGGTWAGVTCTTLVALSAGDKFYARITVHTGSTGGNPRNLASSSVSFAQII